MIRTAAVLAALLSPSLALGAPACWEAYGGLEEGGLTVTETAIGYYEGGCTLPSDAAFDGSLITAICSDDGTDGEPEQRVVTLTPQGDQMLYVMRYPEGGSSYPEGGAIDVSTLSACEPRA